MSLLRQLWITVIAASLIAWLGGFAVSIYTARSYLEQHLLAQGADTATALALSMSQQKIDRAMAEVMVSALFDSGHFERVQYDDIQGRTVVERHSGVVESQAPEWFVRLIPIEAEPGVALVSQGWTQAGRVTIVAHKRFAYDALWRGSLQFSVVMSLLGALLALAVKILMRWMRAPIDLMVEQARAIGERRFITNEEPKIREFRSVVRALNLMVEQVRTMFAEQAGRIEALRSEANRDALTGLPNRSFFLGRLGTELEGEDSPPVGALALIRLKDLTETNRRLGRERTDGLIKAAAGALQGIAGETAQLARLNGADFAWLISGAEPELAEKCAAEAVRALEALRRRLHLELEVAGHVGVTLFRRSDDLAGVLARADAALMRAERGEGGAAVVSGYDTPLVARTQEAWRTLLQLAVSRRSFALATFPVLHIDGKPWHDEAMMRMSAPDGGDPWTAGQFMPAADRLGMTAELDLLAVELALQRLQHGNEAVAVNISPLSLQSLEFRKGLERQLAAAPDAASRLWMEVSEAGLDQGLSGLAAVSPILGQYGSRLGIEHFGRQFSAIPRLYAQRIDYLKIDGSFVAGIAENEGNQRLVKAIADVARGLDILVLAERVSSDAEWRMLADLGVAGVTGPAATAHAQAYLVRGKP